MTGGGGGPIIVRPMLDSGRLTKKEFEQLTRILDRQNGVTFNKRDAATVGRIAAAICQRP